MRDERAAGGKAQPQHRGAEVGGGFVETMNLQQLRHPNHTKREHSAEGQRTHQGGDPDMAESWRLPSSADDRGKKFADPPLRSLTTGLGFFMYMYPSMQSRIPKTAVR